MKNILFKLDKYIVYKLADNSSDDCSDSCTDCTDCTDCSDCSDCNEYDLCSNEKY